MIVIIKFKIDNKVYNTTVKFEDYDEFIINIKATKEIIAEKLISNAYTLNNINDVAYNTTIKNIIVNNIEIMSITIPNYNKTE